jgi:hypothetical protein
MPQDHHAQKPTPELRVEGLEKELKGLRRSFLFGAIGGGGLLVGALVILSERLGGILDLFDRTPVSQARVIVTPHQPIVLTALDVRSKGKGNTVQHIDVADFGGAAQVWIDGDATWSGSIEIAEGSTIRVQEPSSNEIELLFQAKDGSSKTLKLGASDTGAILKLIYPPQSGESTIDTVADLAGNKTVYNVTSVKLDVLGKQATLYLFDK